MNSLPPSCATESNRASTHRVPRFRRARPRCRVRRQPCDRQSGCSGSGVERSTCDAPWPASPPRKPSGGHRGSCGTASSRCSPTTTCRSNRSHAWSVITPAKSPRRSIDTRSGPSSSTAPPRWIRFSTATSAVSHSVRRSRTPRRARGQAPDMESGLSTCTFAVGDTGIEPVTSSV